MLVILMIAVGAPASAPALLCAAPSITSDAPVPEVWRDELEQLCRAFATAPEIDQTAQLSVTPADADLVVEARTADGRRGMRRVREPAMLHDVLEALLALPLTPPAPPAPPEPPVEGPVVSPPAQPHHEVSARLGLGIDTRASQHGRFCVGPTAMAAIYVDDWLLGVTLRWDAVEGNGTNTLPNYEMTAVGFGLTLGRRIHHGSFDLDAGFEPRLISESQSHGDGRAENAVTVTDFWFGGLLRATFGRGSVRPYVQLDGDFAPSRLRGEFRGDDVYAPLPAWSAGLTLGAAWTIE